MTHQSNIAKAFSFFVPLTKKDDEKRMVYGYASTEAVDSDGEIITLEALKGALPGYMKFGNIREMHQLSAVGVAKESEIDDKGLYIGAKIVDDTAWNKVKEGVYKGFSIGGRATQRVGKKITGLELIEISLVDRPANPEALIEVFKAQLTENQMPSPEEKRLALHAAVENLNPAQLEAAFDAFQKRQAEPPVTIDVEPEKAPEPEVEKAAAPEPEPEKAPEIDVDHYATMVKNLGVKSEIKPEALAGILNVKLEHVPTIVKRAAELAALDEPEPEAKEPEKAQTAPEPEKAVEKADAAPSHADPGLLGGTPRFPLDTELAIRAARYFLEKADNTRMYSPEQLDQVLENVRKAWLEKIGPDGAPVAKTTTGKEKEQPASPKPEIKSILSKFGKADATVSVQKGLHSASWALCLLSELNYLQEGLVREAAYEGDNSNLPDRFRALVETMSDLVQALVEEEIEEMLTNKEMEDLATGSYPVLYADKPEAKKAAAERIRKAIGDNTGAPGFLTLSQLADELEKSAEADIAKAKKNDGEESGTGNPPPQEGEGEEGAKGKTDEEDEEEAKRKKAEEEDKEKMGDDCGKAAKSQAPDDTAKSIASLTQAITDLAGIVKSMQENQATGRNPPPAPEKGVLKSMDKAQDHAGQAQDETDPKNPRDVLKAIHDRPNFVSNHF